MRSLWSWGFLHIHNSHCQWHEDALLGHESPQELIRGMGHAAAVVLVKTGQLYMVFIIIYKIDQGGDWDSVHSVTKLSSYLDRGASGAGFNIAPWEQMPESKASEYKTLSHLHPLLGLAKDKDQTQSLSLPLSLA